MTYDQLVQELADRGFNHIPSARRGTYINNARAELDRMLGAVAKRLKKLR